MDYASQFEFTAQKIGSDEYVTGFLWVDRPWYTQENQHQYYIRVQHYFGSYGATRFEDVPVDRTTIKSVSGEIVKRMAEPTHILEAGDTVICSIGRKKYTTSVNLNCHGKKKWLDLGHDEFFDECIYE